MDIIINNREERENILNNIEWSLGRDGGAKAMGDGKMKQISVEKGGR